MSLTGAGRSNGATRRVVREQPPLREDFEIGVSRPDLRGCPHFALDTDRSTSLLFPSAAGYCYKAATPASPRPEHQQAFCLKAQYSTCPVLTAQKPGPLPVDIAESQPGGAFKRRNLLKLGWIVTVVAAVVVILVWSDWLSFLNRFVESNRQAAAQAIPAPETTTATPLPALAQDAATDAFAPAAQMDTVSVPSENTPALSPSPSVVPASDPALPPTDTPSPVPHPMAAVSLDSVTLYKGPAINYPALPQTAHAGDQFEVVGRSETGGWWQVCCLDNQTGWISAESASVTGDAFAVPLVEAPMPQASVLVPALNVRAGPGLNYPVLGVATPNTLLDAVARLPDYTWWQVCCLDGRQGWVIGGAIELLGNPEIVPVAKENPPPPSSAP